jgi:hypothetical protein
VALAQSDMSVVLVERSGYRDLRIGEHLLRRYPSPQ